PNETPAPSAPVSGLLTLWWACWLASAWASQFAARLTFSGNTARELRNASTAYLVGDAIDIAAAALALWVIIRIGSRQELRAAKPTRTALQLCLASLESAEHGFAFSSGLGAVTTIMHLVSPGERVVAVNDVYGGVYRMFSQVYEPKGYEFTWLPAAEFADGLADQLDERTRIVWLETPT